MSCILLHIFNSIGLIVFRGDSIILPLYMVSKRKHTFMQM